MKNGALLFNSVIMQFALRAIVRQGFSALVDPHLVKDDAMVGTAYFPVGIEQAYRIPADEVNLIGTAEVPVTAYHARGDLA